jgi:hypothetical protein
VDGGDGIIAWLALAVAVAALAWQILDASRRRRRHIDVRVRHLALPASVTDGPELVAVPAIGLAEGVAIWPAMEPLSYVVAIVVVNDGESTEYVEDVRIRNLDETRGSGASDGRGTRELRPRERVTWAFRPERAVFDLRHGFHVSAVVASGRPIDSGPHFLDDDLRKSIGDHNAELPSDRRA